MPRSVRVPGWRKYKVEARPLPSSLATAALLDKSRLLSHCGVASSASIPPTFPFRPHTHSRPTRTNRYHHSFGKTSQYIRSKSPLVFTTERLARLRSTMFKRSFGGKDRAGKARKISKRSFKDDAKARMREALNDQSTPDTSPSIGGASPRLNSAIVTICVGKDQRKWESIILKCAHEE